MLGSRPGRVLQVTRVSGSLAGGGASAAGGAELPQGGYFPEGVTRAVVQGGGAGGGRRQVGADLGAVEELPGGRRSTAPLPLTSMLMVTLTLLLPGSSRELGP